MTKTAVSHRLAIDVGNSRIKLGLFVTRPDLPVKQLPKCLRRAVVLAGEPLPWELLVSWRNEFSDWQLPVIAGSNPKGVERIIADWPKGMGQTPRHVTNDVNFPIAIDVDEPRRVGIDRLLNAVAVNSLRNTGQTAVIVDSGTATTVDVVSEKGAFAGGAILPGLALSAKALHQYTALLPLVSVQELGQETPDALGRNTRAAIRSGLFWGQLGAVKELIERQVGDPTEVYVTGGGGALMAMFLRHAKFEPDLSLQGLVCVGDAVAPGS